MGVVGIDVGGTFTDLTEVDEETGAGPHHQGTLYPERRGTGRPRRPRARRGISGHPPHRPRDDGRHHRDRPAPTALVWPSSPPPASGTSSRSAGPAQHPRPLQSDVRPPEAARAAAPPLRGRGAHPARRQRPAPAGQGESGVAVRGDASLRPAGLRGVSALLVRQSRARAAGGRGAEPRFPRRAGVDVVGGRARVPRVRALLDHRLQRLHPAPDGALSGVAGEEAPRRRLSPGRADRGLQRGRADRRRRAALAHQDHRLGAGGRGEQAIFVARGIGVPTSSPTTSAARAPTSA